MNFPQIMLGLAGFDFFKNVLVTRYYFELLIDINERIMILIRKVWIL